MKNILIILFILFVNVVSGQLSATVMAVHDGDSYKVKLDSTNEVFWIRLSDVDAPEVISNYVSANQPHGKEIAYSMRKMLKGNKVILDTLYRDKYKRMVAKVWYNNIDLSKYMVENGFAWYTPFGVSDPEMVKALKLAKKHKLEIWDGKGDKPKKPNAFRAANKWKKK